MISIYVKHARPNKIVDIAFQHGCQEVFIKGSGHAYGFNSVDGAVEFLKKIRRMKTYVEVPELLATVCETYYSCTPYDKVIPCS